MRILIVEDEIANRTLLQACLQDNHETDIAIDGEEAVALFGKAHAEGRPYRLILLDIEMPVMDGQAALKAVREHEKTLGVQPGDKVAVLMISAHDDRANVWKAFFQGQASGYLVKPVGRENLLATINELRLG